MSEDTQVVVTDAPDVDVAEHVDQPENTQSTPQHTEAEEQALEQGWRPKSEWTGDPDKWRSAKEFNERGELFGKIDSMGRDLKDTKRALKMLQEHHSKVKEVEYNKAVTELKALQKRHLEEGNSDGYLEASDILSDLKAEQKAREVIRENTPQAPDPRFLQWQDSNKWYTNDAEMRRYADMIGQGYANQNPGTDPVDVLKYVTSEVKSKYKDKFTNPNRNRPNAVDGGVRGGTTTAKAFEMSDVERQVMNTFLRQGIMEKDEYIAQLKSTRGTK